MSTRCDAGDGMAASAPSAAAAVARPTAPADLGAGTGGNGADAGIGDGSDGGDGGDSSDGGDAGPYDLAAVAPPSGKTPPADGTLLGAFVGVGNNDTPDFLAEEQLIDRRWVIDNRFYSYEDWINDRTRWDIAQKKLPLVTWEPHEPLDEIIAGTHDDIFHMRAQGARDLGVDILLRWGHEMNGNWYPWAGANNGGASGGPAKYIAAYRHVHDLFVADGATNVYWVWCPLVADVPAETLEPLDQLLPRRRLRRLGRPRLLQLGHLVVVLHLAVVQRPVHRPLQRLRGQEAAHRRRDLVGRGRRQQGGLDRRSATAAEDALHRHQGGRLVRHQQRDRLAHRLVAADVGRLQGDGARSLLQSVKRKRRRTWTRIWFFVVLRSWWWRARSWRRARIDGGAADDDADR